MQMCNEKLSLSSQIPGWLLPSSLASSDSQMRNEKLSLSSHPPNQGAYSQPGRFSRLRRFLRLATKRYFIPSSYVDSYFLEARLPRVIEMCNKNTYSLFQAVSMRMAGRGTASVSLDSLDLRCATKRRRQERE